MEILLNDQHIRLAKMLSPGDACREALIRFEDGQRNMALAYWAVASGEMRVMQEMKRMSVDCARSDDPKLKKLGMAINMAVHFSSNRLTALMGKTDMAALQIQDGKGSFARLQLQQVVQEADQGGYTEVAAKARRLLATLPEAPAIAP